MKFGIMNLFPYPEGKSADTIFSETLEEIQYAEELGFDSVWLAEHHFSEYGILGNPLVLAAAIAERTRRIRIGTAVLVLPFYDPIRVAEDCALVDVLSGGRLDVGFGRGYQPAEFKGFRVNQSEARQRTAEYLDVIRLAWTQDSFSYDGQFIKLEDVSVYPKPVQKPHPPLWRAAVSLDTFKMAGANGEAILTSPNFTPLPVVQKQFQTYIDALRKNGYNPDNFDRPLMQQVYIADNDDDAYVTPQRHSMWFYQLLARLAPGAKGEAPTGYEGWEKVARNIGKITYEEVFQHAGNFATPDKAIEKLKILRDVVGVSHYIAWFNFGGLDHKKVMRSMKRFAEEVMPAFR